ncbi:MAG: GGDEF domain-containing protein [Pseudomonadota bacterium]
MSPYFPIILALCTTSLMLSIVFFTAWKTIERMPHTLTWAFAFLLGSVQWANNLARNWYPNYESFWIAANGLSLIVVTLAWLGHCQRVGKPTSHRQIWLFPLPVLLLVFWFTVIQPHAGLRMFLIPAYTATMLLWAAWLVIRHRYTTRPAEWGSAISMILFSLVQLTAGFFALFQGARPDSGLSEIYGLINFLSLPAAYTGMGLFAVFMIASDLSERMRKIAMHDQLTGVLNRRGFKPAAARAFASARRTGTPVSVVMTDIDRFKKINDKYGHLVGDLAIRHFANALASDRRQDDILARIGGEEFVLILPGVGPEASVCLARTLCQNFEANPLSHIDAQVNMTASFGVATISVEDESINDIIARADSALYQSKNNGRNQVDLIASRIVLLPDGSMKSSA